MQVIDQIIKRATVDMRYDLFDTEPTSQETVRHVDGHGQQHPEERCSVIPVKDTGRHQQPDHGTRRRIEMNSIGHAFLPPGDWPCLSAIRCFHDPATWLVVSYPVSQHPAGHIPW